MVADTWTSELDPVQKQSVMTIQRDKTRRFAFARGLLPLTDNPDSSLSVDPQCHLLRAVGTEPVVLRYREPRLRCDNVALETKKCSPLKTTEARKTRRISTLSKHFSTPSLGDVG